MSPLLLPVLLAGLALAEEGVLVYPASTVFQFTVGVSMPIAMDKKGGVVFSVGYQLNYVLPTNASQLEPHFEGRGQRLGLEDVHASLEDLLEKAGWGSGRGCLLRTMCELAEAPLARARGDVLEEVLHLLLTRPAEPGGGCAEAAAACARSPLASFTELAPFERADL